MQKQKGGGFSRVVQRKRVWPGGQVGLDVRVVGSGGAESKKRKDVPDWAERKGKGSGRRERKVAGGLGGKEKEGKRNRK